MPTRHVMHECGMVATIFDVPISVVRELIIIITVITVNLYSAFFVKEPQTRCVC